MRRVAVFTRAAPPGAGGFSAALIAEAVRYLDPCCFVTQSPGQQLGHHDVDRLATECVDTGGAGVGRAAELVRWTGAEGGRPLVMGVGLGDSIIDTLRSALLAA